MHNAQTPPAATAAATDLGIPDAAIQRPRAGPPGIDRRPQVVGELRVQDREVEVIDDYGHHPTEIAATLDALRQAWAGRRIVLVFQPHRYTRTRDLMDDYARVLATADLLLVTEVYPAGEAPIEGADGRAICRAVRSRGKVEPVFVPTVEEIASALSGILRAGDVIAMMGAGSISPAAHELAGQLDALRAAEAPR
jgi:UDP-N-acetylmuramate--alanine ligase